MNKALGNGIKNQRESLLNVFFITLSVPLTVAFFIANRHVPFMMDDLWYSTNLATGEALHGFKGILESQIWHYMNWGGRSVTHALLQLTLMSGEIVADILNTVAFVLLSFMASLFAEKKHRIRAFIFAEALILFSNPDIFHSMLWQAGAVNYVYSSVWILLFIYIYLSKVELESELVANAEFRLISKQRSDLWLGLIMIPLSLITGWSNENMGPASFCLAIMVIGLRLYKKKPVKAWMIVGAAGTLIGSALCILAPGNFVRSEFVEAGSIKEILLERFLTMYEALCSWLLPIALITAVLIAVNKRIGNKLETKDYLILITAVLAYGAMAISPHFPARASFGIMVLLVVEALRLIAKLEQRIEKANKYMLAIGFVLTITDILLLSVGG